MGQDLRFCEVLTDRVENGHRNPAIAACASMLSKTGQAWARAMLAEEYVGYFPNCRSVGPAND